MKRILCLSMVLAMLCALLTFTPASAASIIDSGECGMDLTWEFDSDGTLTISGYGSMYDMSGYGRTAPWKDYVTAIKKLALPAELTYIGSGAFKDCVNLSEVNLPDELNDIGSSAFSGCVNLSKVNLPDELTYIGSYAFSGCVNLSEVNLPDTLEGISECAFEGCSKLKKMNIPQSLTNIGLFAFKGTPLISQKGDFRFLGDDILVEYTGSGKEVIIPDGVRVVADEIFAKESQEWPGSIEHNENITKLVFPDSVKYIGTILPYCRKLADIKFPSGLISIEGQSYESDGTLPWYDNQPDGVVYIGDIAFGYKGYPVPTVVEIKEGTRSICSEFFGYRYAHPGADKVILPDSVERVENSAFYGSEVNLPKNLKYIGNSAFQRCHITPGNVDIPNGVTKIGDGAFYYCKGITSLNIPDSVTWIDEDAFSGNTDLTSVTLSNSVTRIDGGAFKDCTGLKDVYYIGTEQEWNNIKMGTYNEPLLNASIHYNYDMPVSEVVVQNDRIEISTNLDNLVEPTKKQKSKVYVALYDKNDALIDSYIADYDGRNIQGTLENNAKADHIKVFVWNKDGSLEPITDTAEYINLKK